MEPDTRISGEERHGEIKTRPRICLLIVAMLAAIGSYLYMSFNPRVDHSLTPITLTVGESTTVDLNRLDPFGFLPARPNVLVIGDSISIGYTETVRTLLIKKANVWHARTGSNENSGSTVKGLRDIDFWLAQGNWHLVYFNWGLHDIGVANPAYRTSVEEYVANLEKLIERMGSGGVNLVFTTTTPSTNWPKNEQIKLYNEAAMAVMRHHGVPVLDLYAAVLPSLEEWQFKDGVHFSVEAYRKMGQIVAHDIAIHLRSLGTTTR